MQYDESVLIPAIVAESVCLRKYTGHEISSRNRAPSTVAKVEAARRAMSAGEVREFVAVSDARCRRAYKLGADWIVKCMESETNKGRDELHMWMSHWLSSYLLTRNFFLRE